MRDEAAVVVDKIAAVDRQSSRAIRWLRLLIAAALLIPAAVLAIVAWYTRADTLGDAERNARRTVVALAEHALKVFETHGLVLDLLDETTRGLSCEALRTMPTLPGFMKRATDQIPQIETVWVLDEHGYLCVASNPERLDDKPRADRDYFLRARDTRPGPTGQYPFVIGRGVVGRIGNVLAFNVSRRRASAQDDFTGIVLAAVELKYFLDYWRGIASSRLPDRIALYRDDGALLVRSWQPFVVDPEPAGEERIRAQWAAAPEGVRIGPSPVDGVETIAAWKLLPRWGIALTYSIDKAAALRDWREAMLLYALLAALVSAALMGASAAALRWVRREEIAARRGRDEMARRLEAEEALRQSQKMEAVGQLTGGVAHDFNNLIMAVTGNLELLKKRLPDDPLMQRLLDNAMQGANRGAALTQRMLAFARRQDLKPEAIDVPSLVRGMADLLQRSTGAQVQIETHFPMRLAPALADHNQLELALLNLVVNARDAMPDGGTIAIAAREEMIGEGHATGLPPGAYVCTTVTDSGAGMDQETLRRAAEPFFTTRAVGKGTGLGLAMVHGLAAQSGGRLVLRSRPGQGTTAELWLPQAERVVPEAAAPSTDMAQPERAEPCTVLVVDDDARARERGRHARGSRAQGDRGVLGQEGVGGAACGRAGRCCRCRLCHAGAHGRAARGRGEGSPSKAARDHCDRPRRTAERDRSGAAVPRETFQPGNLGAIASVVPASRARPKIVPLRHL